MKNLFIATCLLPITSLLFAEELPPAADIFIESIDYNGNGCPAGSVAEYISRDGQSFSILYDSFYVDTDMKRGGFGLASRTCNLRILINIPEGWSYGLASMHTRGYASLDRGTVSKQSSNYKFVNGSGSPVNLGGWQKVGPFDNDFIATRPVPVNSINWSPCGNKDRALEIKTVISITKGFKHPGAQGLVTVDSQDGTMTDQYNITWKKCKKMEESSNETIISDIRDLMPRIIDEASATADLAKSLKRSSSKLRRLYNESNKV